MAKWKFEYLAASSRYVEILVQKNGIESLKECGLKLWLHSSDHRSPELVRLFESVGIVCTSNYSSGEAGPIAFECTKERGHYHVASTNIFVETDKDSRVEYDGQVLEELLITHLHSFATPLIRYRIGDFGQLHDQCPCGFRGKTLSHIYGRGKHFLKHPHGHLVPFYVSTRLLMSLIDFEECRIYQDDVNSIHVEFARSTDIDDALMASIVELFKSITDSVFEIHIHRRDHIDWNKNPKKLLFTNYISTS